ncbi:COG1832 Predicted CoA-binding protein [Candidatus Nanopelagicaceae bacterium]
MTWSPQSNEEIKAILQESKNVAIVGISNKPDRASYQVAEWLQQNSHFTLFFVNPVIDEVLGQQTYPSLGDIPEQIDIVDVFRKAEDCLTVLEKAIAIGAKTIWLQLGISNDEVAAKGSVSGMQVVMDRCIKIDYAALVK